MSVRQLRRLQQATAALSRAVDVDEIARELGRGVASIVDVDGVFVAHAELERQTVRVLYQEVGRIAAASPREVPLGEGAIAQVARSGESWCANGADAHDAAAADGGIVPADPPPGCLLVVPVMHGRRMLAVVGAHAGWSDGFSESAVAAVRTLATQAAMALSNAQLFAESERERRQTDALADAARAVNESLRMGEVVLLILRHATRLLRGEGACVALREGNYLNVVAAVGTANLLSGVHLPLQGSLAGQAVREGTAVIANDVAGDPEANRSALRFANASKAIIVPLTTARGILGALLVFNRAEHFGAEDARVLQRLADQVVVAIVNARLFEQVTDAARAWTATFDSIGLGMAIVDDQGCIVRYNTRARQLASGDEPRELAGQPFYEAVLGAALQPNDNDPIARALADSVLVRTSLAVAGGTRRLQLTAAPHLDRGVIVTFDVTPDDVMATGDQSS